MDKMILASPDRFAENIGIVAVVVPELKLRNVERQIFWAELVERADNAAFEDRPEALNRLCVDRTNDVLASSVIDDPVGVHGIQSAIANPLIRAEKANLLRYCAAHEGLKNVGAYAVDDAGNNLTLALDSADDRDFTRAGASTPGAASLIPMPV